MGSSSICLMSYRGGYSVAWSDVKKWFMAFTWSPQQTWWTQSPHYLSSWWWSFACPCSSYSKIHCHCSSLSAASLLAPQSLGCFPCLRPWCLSFSGQPMDSFTIHSWRGTNCRPSCSMPSRSASSRSAPHRDWWACSWDIRGCARLVGHPASLQIGGSTVPSS